MEANKIFVGRWCQDYGQSLLIVLHYSKHRESADGWRLMASRLRRKEELKLKGKEKY